MTAKPELSNNREKGGDHTTLIVSGIPETLKTEFKLHCVRKGLTMSKVLVETIRQLVSR